MAPEDQKFYPLLGGFIPDSLESSPGREFITDWSLVCLKSQAETWLSLSMNRKKSLAP
jgi:hypothetical protein